MLPYSIHNQWNLSELQFLLHNMARMVILDIKYTVLENPMCHRDEYLLTLESSPSVCSKPHCTNY